MPNTPALVGAGASHDCHIEQFTTCVNRQWTPPLTQHLFSNARSFENVLNRYPRLQFVAAEFISKFAADPAFRIEGFMRDLLSREDARSCQDALFISLYLRDLFSAVSDLYVTAGNGLQAINAYTDLVGAIYNAYANERKFTSVTFLTTNYDTLLDRAIENRFSIGFSNIEKYIEFEKNWALIKFHGSTNWHYQINGEAHKLPINKGIASDRTLAAINDGFNLRDLSKSTDIFVSNRFDQDLSGNRDVWFPAIAIPVDRKEGAVCPKTHVDYLVKLLQDQARSFDLLVIGFSAIDQDLISVFGGYWDRLCRLMIVNGNEQSSAETQQRFLDAGVNRTICKNWSSACWKGGFANFVLHRNGLREFLERNDF